MTKRVQISTKNETLINENPHQSQSFQGLNWKQVKRCANTEQELQKFVHCLFDNENVYR
jgi:hypothetical protein